MNSCECITCRTFVVYKALGVLLYGRYYIKGAVRAPLMLPIRAL